jgi:hypothetical protein
MISVAFRREGSSDGTPPFNGDVPLHELVRQKSGFLSMTMPCPDGKFRPGNPA